MELRKDNQNGLKDTPNSGLSLTDTSFVFVYSKTAKLITALYMVTDIMDKDEPIRQKLRSLGSNILTDINLATHHTIKDNGLRVIHSIRAVTSFLDMALSLRMISEMNSGILKKAFSELKNAIEPQIPPQDSFFGSEQSLAQFLTSSNSSNDELETRMSDTRKLGVGSMGHSERVANSPTRLGVQKGDTFMKALSDKISSLREGHTDKKENFDLIKKERRSQILSIIKNANAFSKESIGLTITDIKSKAEGPIKTASEKTLQRELMSMVKDNVLYKKGEKRWSKYFIKKPL